MKLCRLTRLLSFSLLALFFFTLLLFPSAVGMTAMQGFPSLESPPLVRLTGSFLGPNEPIPSGVSTLRVSFKDAQRIFVVKRLEKLTGRPTTDLRLLGSLFPPVLRFLGPPAVLNPLRQANTVGKSFVLEGRLYPGDNMLLLLTVTEAQP